MGVLVIGVGGAWLPIALARVQKAVRGLARVGCQRRSDWDWGYCHCAYMIPRFQVATAVIEQQEYESLLHVWESSFFSIGSIPRCPVDHIHSLPPMRIHS